MKLALDIGTRNASVAWATGGAPELIPLDDNAPQVEALLLWGDNRIVAVGDQARLQVRPDSIVLESFKQDFARQRLRHTVKDNGDAGNGSTASDARHSTMIPVGGLTEVCPPDYDGPFYRAGLVRTLGGLLWHIWDAIVRFDEDQARQAEGMLIGVPFTFHEFAKRRYLHALKNGLADHLFPRAGFYQYALSKVGFVPEPTAVLCSLDHLYGGAAAAVLDGKAPANALVVDVGAGAADCALYETQPAPGDSLIAPGRMLGVRTTRDAGNQLDLAILDGLRARDESLSGHIEGKFDDAAFRLKLFDSIQAAKHTFSDPSVAESMVQIPDGDLLRVKRESFSEWIEPVVRRIAASAVEAVGDAGLAPNEVGLLVCAGGSALLPELQQALKKEFDQVPTVVPETRAHKLEAMSAVTRGLSRHDAVTHGVGRSTTNRRISLYNCNWAPQEQFPPAPEKLVLTYDPLEPDRQKHKDFWWAYLQVPPGFSKLTVQLFETQAREEHLFTLYGIPVRDSNEMHLPARFQVYIDPVDRIVPRIWVWDVRLKKFLIKGFDASKRPEEELADFIENERAAFPFTAGDRFDGRPLAGELAWLPMVKRLSRGDKVRVMTGDRTDPDWFNTVDQGGEPVTPGRTITHIYPRQTTSPSGPGMSSIPHWILSEFLIAFDDEQPRNLQGLFVEHMPDPIHDPDRLVARIANALAPLHGRSPAASQQASSATVAASSGRVSRAPRLGEDGGSGEPDPFGGATPNTRVFDSSDSHEGSDVFGTGQMPVSPEAVPVATMPTFDDDPWPADVVGQPVHPGAEMWSDSSHGGVPTRSVPQDEVAAAAPRSPELSTSSMPQVAPSLPAGAGSAPDTPAMRDLKTLGIPASRGEARNFLKRLLTGVLDGEVPPDTAEASVAIIRALFEVTEDAG